MTRRENDFYETPKAMTEVLLDQVLWSIRPSVLLEPAAGDLAMARVLDSAGWDVITNDVDPSKQTEYHLDATQPDLYEELGDLPWLVTNPPFSQAFEIARAAWPHVDNMAMLLRLSWLEPTKERGPWLQENPPDRLIIFGSPRPSFTGKGTDSVTTAWMVWSDWVVPGISFKTNWR